MLFNTSGIVTLVIMKAPHAVITCFLPRHAVGIKPLLQS